MKKIKRWILPAVVVLCVILFIVYCIWDKVAHDEDAPVISIEEGTLSLSVWDGEEGLLNGVTAWDEQDGDVTDLLVVEGVSSIDKNHCATVTYAAFDRAGHVSKATRNICYSDYEAPRFELSSALMFHSGYPIDVYDYLTAVDTIDGELNSQIKANLVEGENDLSTVGTHLVEFRVTNSMGDTVRLTVPVWVYLPSDYNATISLTDYLVYLEQGQHFDGNFYLDSMNAGGQTIPRNVLAEDDAFIDIHSDVQPDIPGTYCVTYTVTWKHYTAASRLIVVVEE